jgi:hypothetical protein
VKRNDAAAKSIQATLELLGQEQARLAELAIFPEDADIPLIKSSFKRLHHKHFHAGFLTFARGH